MTDTARWPGPNAGWRVGMCVEAYLAVDFFPQGSLWDWYFLHHIGTSLKAGAKST